MAAIRPTQPRKEDAPLSFEFEDGTPAVAPPSPAAAPDAAPVFNPFADQPVISLDAVPPAPSSPSAPTGKTAPASIAPAPIAPQSSVGEEANANRDLWYCPHCGAGNQPKRTTCRDCNKSPADPVVVPFYRSPLGIGTIAAAVLLALFIGWRMTRTDTSFHSPGPAGVDVKVRTWGLTDKDMEVGPSRLFNQRGNFSVSGRVIAAKSVNGYEWITTVILALGPEVTSDAFPAWGATISDNDCSSNAPNYLVIHCLFDNDAPELKKGAYLSLSGLRGNIQFEARLVSYIKLDQGHMAVKVEKFEISDGK